MNPDEVTWEAEHSDGETLRSADGALYKDINRETLATFRLLHKGESLFAVKPQPGTILTYRRRTSIVNEHATVQYIVGNFPHGDVTVLDTVTGELHVGRFEDEHPSADFSFPELLEEEQRGFCGS